MQQGRGIRELSWELAIGNRQLAKEGFVEFRGNWQQAIGNRQKKDSLSFVETGNRQLAIDKRMIRELSW